MIKQALVVGAGYLLPRIAPSIVPSDFGLSGDILGSLHPALTFALRNWVPALMILVLGAWYVGVMAAPSVRITTQRVILTKGFFVRTCDEIELFRVRDVVASQTLLQRLAGVGNVTIEASRDLKAETFELSSFDRPFEIRELVRDAWAKVGQPQRTLNVD
ncbi:PH domain-containing protein [Bosea sp. RAC05]|uniref:PH domain-containing protein n=1 Tax=Bosea sp. RAC05 TaxID=1842539 RepID=UPI001F3FCFE5|nr:PH domain-containing protein [Bosea sp. RAC05]